MLGTIVIPTTTEGANQLLEWAAMFGIIDRIGIEGTGAYGARLARIAVTSKTVRLTSLLPRNGSPPW